MIRAAHHEESSMRFNSPSTALPVFGIIAVLAACTTGRSNHPSSAITGNPSPVSQQVATERQALSKQAIRSVDFANFTFPWPSELGDSKKTFTLRSGELKPSRDEKGAVDEMGATLESIVYGDLTKDGVEEAMVVLNIITGGSAVPHAVYLYAPHDGRVILLWAFSTGDRAEGGLRQLYAESGDLMLERYSPVGSRGDCCPTLFTRARFEWQDNRFRQKGKEETLPNPQAHGSPIMAHYQPSS
jgi:hypothetical protein